MWRVVFNVLLFVLASAQQDAAKPKDYKSVSKESNKKIGMVISTLQDILQSVKNEQTEETEMYKKYMKWCDDEKASIAKSLEESRKELADAKVLSEEQVSSIDSLTLFIKKNEKEIEETKDAVAQAVSLRTSENEKYTEEMQLNTQSLRQIDLAIKHVSKVQKQGGFLQNGVLKKMQINAPGESSYVLGIMKGLDEKLKKTRAELEKVEKEKVTMHDSFMDTKGKSLESLSSTNSAKKISLAETTAKEAGTKRKIGKLTEEVEKLTQNGIKTAETCQSTSTEWQVRESDRVKEKAALNEAIRFLMQDAEKKGASLATVAIDEDQQEPDAVVFAPSFVQVASDSSVSASEFYKEAGAALMGEDEEVEGHMKKDTFNGIRGVVTKLITTHQDTQDEEKTKKEYCNKQIAQMDDDKATTEDDLAAVKANIEKKSSEVEQLTDEVKNLYKQIDEAAASLKKAGEIRKEEKALYEASTKDRTLAIKVLRQATSVLQNFYDQKSALVQGNSERQPANPVSPGSQRKSAAAFGAVSMVQDIADDIAKEQKDATMEEGEAAATYAKLEKDTRSSTDDTHQDITDRVTAKAKLGVQINTLKETQIQMNDDLTAVNKQLEALHKSCDELVANYDKRKKARAFEVSQLRDVNDILAGSSIAARTGFLQADDAGADSEGEADTTADSE